MKEEKYIENLFEKARNEKPKMSYKVVATGFLTSTTIGAFAGIKTLLSQNIYLNSFVGITMTAAVTSTVVTTNTANTESRKSLKVKKEYVQTFAAHEMSLKDVPTLFDVIEEQKVEVLMTAAELKKVESIVTNRSIRSLMLANNSSPMTSATLNDKTGADNNLAHNEYEIDKVYADHENQEMDIDLEESFAENNGPRVQSNQDEVLGLKRKQDEDTQDSNSSRDWVVKKDVKSIDADQLNQNLVGMNDGSAKQPGFNKDDSEEEIVSVNFVLNSSDSEEQLKAFYNNLNYNGINVEMKHSLNFGKDKIKKLTLEMSDAEGYVQKVVATDFESIEIFWKLDLNGYPYDVYILWDREQVYPIDLKDKMFPIHKYKG